MCGTAVFFVVVMSLRFELRPDVGSLSFDVQSSETVLSFNLSSTFHLFDLQR